MDDTTRRRTSPHDPRSTGELFHQTLLERADEDPEQSSALSVLLSRNSQDVYHVAQQWLCHGFMRERIIGAFILGHLGAMHCENPDLRHTACLGALLHACSQSSNPFVLAATLTALGRLQSPIALMPLVARRDHPASAVRRAVAVALHTTAHPLAVDTQIILSHDRESTVRLAATVALHHLTSADGDPWDTEMLRSALAARIVDEAFPIRQEAIAGLVIRGDDRGLEALLIDLAVNQHAILMVNALVNAGTIFADARLTPHLLQLHERVRRQNTPAMCDLLGRIDLAILRCHTGSC